MERRKPLTWVSKFNNITSDADYQAAQARWEKSIEDVLVEIMHVTDKEGTQIMVSGTPVANTYRALIEEISRIREAGVLSRASGATINSALVDHET